ncbi:SusC/RagA family TonB-linked outer membrane protein [Sphingobacterium siyangense]|uniref:SusC/RagA family TonB-linked outer membrane protein n=1 Tax=Sphingobacterium siyangense TaxID=459529 RepID=UPI003C73CE0C
MKRTVTYCTLFFLLSSGYLTELKAVPYSSPGGVDRSLFTKLKNQSDTVSRDSVVFYSSDPTKPYLGVDTVNISGAKKRPYLTLQQMLKGTNAGVYVQEPSGEPGTIKQNVLIRGLSRPIITIEDVNKSKPLIVINGIPLIDDQTLSYAIQNYSLQPIGAATNINSIFNMDNIESINILKDYGTAGIFGPRASNGVIYITTKNAKAGQRKISVNSHYGYATPSSVTTINAAFEKQFRSPFYAKYATESQLASYPAYLSDSSNVNFYGPSNWTDIYYKAKPIYDINGSLEGGSQRANFRFFGNYAGDAGAADETNLNRYQAAFYLNMLPIRWLTISSMIQGTRMNRDRNRSITERLGETAYIPDLSTPLAPNKDLYGLYVDEYKKSLDDNNITSLLGSFALNFAILKNLNFAPKLYLDYNENVRNVFWPSTLMSGNNYVSNYYGYNERMVFDNTLNYKYTLDDKSDVLIEAGFNYQSDKQKYNFIQGYKGPNDFIKVNVVEGDSQKSNYLKSVGFIPYYYQDRIDFKLASAYLRGTYTLNNVLKLGALVRRDGSSAVQSDHQWFTSYTFNGEYDFNSLLKSELLGGFKLLASWGRLGNLPSTDIESAGPQYGAELGWNSNKNVISYNGIGTITRPYQSGWIGYNLPWSYTDMFNAGIDFALKGDRVTSRIEFYNKDNQDVSFTVPTVAESGYQFERLNGMAINNKGIDFTINFNFPASPKRLSWNSSFNLSYNTNELKALPNGLRDIEIGNRKLAIGNRIDQFWVLKNQGIYENDLDVPVNADHKILTYNGTVLKGGDPRWLDSNGDFDINNNDRVLMGNYIPKFTGGFYNRFAWNNFDLSFLLYFNLKKDALNAQAARYFDFANQDEGHTLNSVRDITYWEKNFDETAYPLYNPWSPVSPYQAEQDMFLEDASFAKLRNLTFGYDFTSLIKRHNERFSKMYLYLSGSNLLTLTKYSGRDPELVNFYGYDTGEGLRLPKTIVLGIKLDF